MTNTKKHMIWSSYNLNLNDWRDGIKEMWEMNDIDPSTKTEDDCIREMYEANWNYLDDERCNLNIPVEGRIILIADIGIWNGRRIGYKLLDSRNINSCLEFEKDCDWAEWYVDNHNDLRSSQTHHDGTHHIRYREVKPEITSDQLDNFCWKLYNGKATARDISKYTRSLGKRVKQVYGW